MHFHKVVRSVEALVPPAFEVDIQQIEFREDPLTGVPCRINARRARRPKQTDESTVTPVKLTEKPGDCPFCLENIEQKTPLFPKHICRTGRIKRGPCYLFPNLFPLAEYHATATLAYEHFLELDQFAPEMLIANLIATREYLLSVYENNKEARYPLYVWNHLPPSAASIIHPHSQILVSRRPTPYQEKLLAASEQHFLQTGESFWRELVAEEKMRGERYVGERGSLSVIATYAPQGNREIQVIFKEISNLVDLDELQMKDFADSVIRILHGYKQMGIDSFNLSTFSGPIGEKLGYYSLNAKVISRPRLQPFYRNDTGPLERLHYETDIETEPEVVAREMRPFFQV